MVDHSGTVPSFSLEETEQSSKDGFIKFLLITANVGSLFEETCQIQTSWLSEILKRIRKSKAQFIAMHVQEVGGKDYEKCMCQVQEFISKFQSLCAKFGYNDGYAFLDQDFVAIEQFTALGSIYLFHESLSEKVGIWDFDRCEFCSIQKFEIVSSGLSSVSKVQRHRFCQDFFPELAFSRKGFMRTRFCVNDLVADFVNVHLFHDGCNVTALESPMLFAGYRRKALKYILKSLLEDKSVIKALQSRWNSNQDLKEWMCPVFLFGDFNFRLDNRTFVKRLTVDTDLKRMSLPFSASSPSMSDLDSSASPIEESSINGLNNLRLPATPVVALEFQRKTSKECVLSVKKKRFDYSDHSALPENWRWYLQDDKELKEFPELFECPLTFAPTYPWTEEVDAPQGYMKTRAPAWCDRVVMNGAAWQLLMTESMTEYGSIGAGVCMGDHKPVYLSLTLPGRVDDILMGVQRPLTVSSGSKEKAKLTGAVSSPGHLRMEFGTFAGGDTDNTAFGTVSHDQAILDAVLSLKPLKTDPASLPFNPITEHEIYTLRIQKLIYDRHARTWRSGKAADIVPGSNPATDTDFITIITLHDDEETATVLDASCFGFKYGNYSTLSTVREETTPLSSNSGTSLIGEEAERAFLIGQRERGSMVIGQEEKRAMAIGRKEKRATTYRKVGATARDSMENLPLLDDYVKGFKGLKEGQGGSTGRIRRVRLSSLERANFGQKYTSIVTVEDERGEPEIVYGRLSSVRDPSGKRSSAKGREKSTTSNSESSSTVTAGRRNEGKESDSSTNQRLRKKSKKSRDENFAPKKCQVKLGDNSLARELRSREKRGLTQFTTDWTLKREDFAVELWTMKLKEELKARKRADTTLNVAVAKNESSVEKKGACTLM